MQIQTQAVYDARLQRIPEPNVTTSVMGRLRSRASNFGLSYALLPLADVAPAAQEPTPEVATEERLFSSSVALKVMTSQFWMHLPDEWRHRVFKQIDKLYDVEEWQDDDKMIDLASFKTFLRTMTSYTPKMLSGYGIGSTGNFAAAWRIDDAVLTLEFASNDEIRYSFTRGKWPEPSASVATGKLHINFLGGLLKYLGMADIFQDANAEG